MPTYSITINANPYLRHGTVSRTRRSARRYEACLVATATQNIVDDIAVGLADHRSSLETEKLKLSELVATHKTTVDAARYLRDQQLKVWHNALNGEITALRKASIEADIELSFPEIQGQARANIVARGFADPYEGPLFEIIKVAIEISRSEHAIAHYEKLDLQVGQQLVLSWHKDEVSAKKALRAKAALHYVNRGYEVAVRTDIQS